MAFFTSFASFDVNWHDGHITADCKETLLAELLEG